MDPLTALAVPGVLGGLVVAALLWVAHLRSRADRAVVPGRDTILIDAINISHIPVAGVGGLGLVAIALVVAAFVPAIRVSIAVALASGVITGGLIIALRRGAPLTSAGRRQLPRP